jgi:hypothetical protein
VVDLEIGHHAGLFDDMRAFGPELPGGQHLPTSAPRGEAEVASEGAKPKEIA